VSWMTVARTLNILSLLTCPPALALRWAARFGRVECLKLLLDDGRSDVAALDCEGLRSAAIFGRLFLHGLLRLLYASLALVGSACHFFARC
jgi:hypothetical protein